jgi:capsular polysaccharide biosynthesis protein
VTPIDLLVSDRIFFFSEVFRDDISLEELMRFYIGFHGPIFNDQKDHLEKKLNLLLAKSGLALPAASLFGAEGRVDEAFLLQNMPQLANRYYDVAGEERFREVEILAPTPNDLREETLPPPLNQRSHRTDRAAFFAYSANTPMDLFVGPHQYQLFDAAAGVQFSGASLRAYSKDIEAYKRTELDRPVVLVQDYGDGGNFAHFAFDWITRVMYSIELELAGTAGCMFVLGGTNGPFQQLIISTLRKIYKVDDAEFYFPETRVMFHLSKGATFFSDQKLIPLHPAQMAHPRSVALLRKLSSHIISDLSTSKKLYISRLDAKLRKVENEHELIAIAESFGFKAIQMGDLKIEDQIAIVRNARYVVGPHGMGMTHIMFNEGPLDMLELFHPTLGTDAYAMMARAFGFKYSFVVGIDLEDNKGSYHIDPFMFSQALEKLIQSPQDRPADP